MRERVELEKEKGVGGKGWKVVAETQHGHTGEVRTGGEGTRDISTHRNKKREGKMESPGY